MDEIVTCLASYLLDRPPNLRSTASDTKGKSKARVKEIGSLINAIDVHANFFGIKFLEGVFGEERNYKLERFVHGKNPNAGRPIKDDLDFRYYDWNRRNENLIIRDIHPDPV